MGLQERAQASPYIQYRYGSIVNKINDLLPLDPSAGGRHFADEEFDEVEER